jgi:hypothetical protein
MEMDERLIEIEVQKRVNFRIQQIRELFEMRFTAIKLADKYSWGHIQTRAYLECSRDYKEVLEKELSMGTPFDGALVQRTWERKEEAVNKISDRLIPLGSKNDISNKSFINDCIENLIYTK